MRALGGLLFVAGLAALAYFIFSFDTSVASNATSSGSDLLGSTGRIGNLGLQNDRVCCCIGAATLTVAGAVLSSAGEILKALTGSGAFTPAPPLTTK